MEEDRLRDKIQEGQQLIQRLQDQLYENMKQNEGLLDAGIAGRIDNAQAYIREAEQRLERLYTYNAASAGFFSDYQARLSELEAGVAAVANSQAWNASSGTFDVKKLDMSWSKPITKAWKEREYGAEAIELSEHLMTEFGFSEDEVKVLMKLYSSILESSSDRERASTFFWRMIASPIYMNSLSDKLMWGYTGNLDKDWRLKLHDYGLTEDEIVLFEKVLWDQYNICSGSFTTGEDYYVSLALNENKAWDQLSQSKKSYYNDLVNRFSGKGDLSHMAATITAYQTDRKTEDDLGNLLGIFGLVGLDQNAGYIGDCAGIGLGVKQTPPSLGPDDYISDLDSVNIFARGGTITALNEYYTELKNGDTKRSTEFLSSIGNGSYDEGVFVLQSQYRDFMNSSLYAAYTDEQKAIFPKFILNVLNGNESLK